MIGLPSLDTPWSIGEEKYSRILDQLSNTPVKGIIEFGSGHSTVRLGLDYPNATIISVEDSAKHLADTRRLLDEFSCDNVRLIYAPLRPLRVGSRFFLTYDAARIAAAQISASVDFILVDGPIEAKTLRGREAALYMSSAHLRLGGIVVLDDYHRKSARTVVSNWLSSYPGGYEEIQVRGRDIAILSKTRDVNCRMIPGIAPMVDNWLTLVKLLARRSWESRHHLRQDKKT